MLTKEYLFFESAKPGCFSELGRQLAQPTRINLEVSPQCSGVVTITHEVFHALGFPHEHQRPDRDNFLRIRWDKIHDRTLMENIQRWSENDTYRLYTPYDYYSIMHYSNDEGIFEPFNSYYTDIIRFQKDMSIGDEIALNLHFNCPSISRQQFERYNNYNDHNVYQELKQFDIRESAVTLRSYLLYPPRIVVETVDDVEEQYPKLAGEFRKTASGRQHNAQRPAPLGVERRQPVEQTQGTGAQTIGVIDDQNRRRARPRLL